MSQTPATDPIRSETEMLPGLRAEEVVRRLGRAGRQEETGQRVLAYYLVEMDARRLYQCTGHGSTAYFAEVRLGIDRRRTAELLRVGRKLLELVEIDRAFCAGRIGWAKVLVLARAASPQHEAAWLERALALDCRELAALARRSREGGPPRKAGDGKGLPEIRFPVTASLGVLAHAKLDRVQAKLAAELDRPVGVTEIFETLMDDFLASEPDGSVPGRQRIDGSLYRVVLTGGSGGRGGPGGKEEEPLLADTEDGPLPVEEAEAVRCDAETLRVEGDGHIELDVKTPPALRRKVLTRDGVRCRSCRSRHELMVHHMEFRGEGGRTSAENLISVCARCHGLVHARLLLLEGASAAEARFVDAAHRPLEGVEPGEAIAAPVGAGAAGGDVVPEVVPEVVTLERVPEVVDAAWWRRHAHLFRDRGESGGLRFEAGVALDLPEGAVGAAPEPAAESFAGLVGQDERVQRLRAVAEGTRARGRSFPHTLFTGPAGTGKTRLARGIAACLGRRLLEISAPLATDRATWVRLLASVEEGGVLFLDEAHALPRPLLEVLLQALSEARLTLTVGDGVRARTVTVSLPRFTLVAATTDEGALPAALRSRFGLRESLVHYSPEDLAALVREAAAAQGAETTAEAARSLAEAARGTPREALRLLDRALDDMAAHGASRLDAEGAGGALARLGYDQYGLDPTEQRYVAVLRGSHAPVPLSRLARILGASPSTLAEHVEPHLFERGLVRMTLGGRVASPFLRRRGAPSGPADVPHARRVVEIAPGSS